MSDSRIDELRMVDPVLTTVAQGYSNAAMVGEYLFPLVPVAKLKGTIPLFDKNAFLVRDTERAIRAGSNRTQPGEHEMKAFETRERDIETAIDYLEEEESPDFFKYEERVAKELMDILLLGREKEAADIAQDASNYDVSHVSTIISTTAFDDYTNETDPVQVIRDGMAVIRSKIARYPNTMIIGDATYQAMIQHPKIIDRIKYSGLTNINTDVLAKLLDIPIVRVGMAVYSDDGETFNDVWDDNIVLAYVDSNEKANRSEFNPSYGYTFQREGKPEIDTYFENGGKIKVIRNTDNFTVLTTAADAAFLIANTNHS